MVHAGEYIGHVQSGLKKRTMHTPEVQTGNSGSTKEAS